MPLLSFSQLLIAYALICAAAFDFISCKGHNLKCSNETLLTVPHSYAWLLSTDCGSSQPTISACQTVLILWQEAGRETPVSVLFLQYSWQREAMGTIPL